MSKVSYCYEKLAKISHPLDFYTASVCLSRFGAWIWAILSLLDCLSHRMARLSQYGSPVVAEPSRWLRLRRSDRENYFKRARQNVRQAFSALPDILNRCQTFFPVDDWQILLVILVFLVEHFMCTELCWTKCPARSELSAGQQQKSAGHVRHVRHISRSLETCGSPGLQAPEPF